MPGDSSIRKDEIDKIKNADVMIFIYDLSNLDIFKFLPKLMGYIREKKGLNYIQIIIGKKKTKIEYQSMNIIIL